MDRFRSQLGFFNDYGEFFMFFELLGWKRLIAGDATCWGKLVFFRLTDLLAGDVEC